MQYILRRNPTRAEEMTKYTHIKVMECREGT